MASSADALGLFGPAVRAWFGQTHGQPTLVQTRGWPILAAGHSALLSAPTGSGKTLAAFLTCLDRLGSAPAPASTQVVYISPLKALAYDIERNLIGPLAQIADVARSGQLSFRTPTVAVRTGDTGAADRRRQLRDPPDILITTPESLYLMLTSSAREGLRRCDTIIVDEIHALAGNKRGAHLAISLERLTELCDRPPQRIGLSATVRPLDEVARYLGGPAPVDIVDASAPPRIDLCIEVPVADMTRPADSVVAEDPALSPEERTSVMPALFRRIHELVTAHRSTIVFVNSRRLAERIAHQLNQLSHSELARAHHGSVARGERIEIEDLMVRGLLRCIVATSSLELGIDMAAVDLVIQVESPGSVARGLQRIGRAGHAVGQVSRGRLLPKMRGDLLEAAVVCRAMMEGDIEPVRVPRAPLDVLAQQIVAMVASEDWSVSDLHAVLRRAAPYRDLSASALESVLDMLSGRVASHELAELPPRISWDRTSNRLAARRSARLVALTNPGTIADRGTYPVYLGSADGPRVGELDEEMVYESRPGETFLLGATCWRIEDIDRDRIIVSPAPGQPGRMPFWRGEGPGRPAALGRRIGNFLRRYEDSSVDDARQVALAEAPLDGQAADNLCAYLDEQREATGRLPSDRTVVVERFADELGDMRVCILSHLGGPVHAPWAVAIEAELERRLAMPVHVVWTDDGITFRLPQGTRLDGIAQAITFDPAALRSRITDQLPASPLFAAAFREAAGRALLVPRRRPGARRPLWSQRLRAQQLLAAAARHAGFPLTVEAHREVLSDRFDLESLSQLMTDIGAGTVDIHVVDSQAPSPFARQLAFAYQAAYVYENDAPGAESRAVALTVDRQLLRELIGDTDVGDLLDAEVVREVEHELQAVAEAWMARDRDELEDALRRLGPLDAAAVAERAAGDGQAWLDELLTAKRAVEVGAGRYTTPEVAERLLAAQHGNPSAIDDALHNYARWHGPFALAAAADHLGIAPDALHQSRDRLLERGQLERGRLSPTDASADLCHPDILRRLRQRSVDALRRDAQAVPADRYASYLHSWHRIDRGDRGAAALDRAVRQLSGLALPLGDLDSRILPRRVSDYQPAMLDEMGARGDVVWIGAGRLGRKDGRIVLVHRDHLAACSAPEVPPDLDAGEQSIVECLGRRGASFQLDIERDTGLAGPHLAEPLWRLVWRGIVTNDTLAPARIGWRPKQSQPTRASRRSRSVHQSRFAGGGRWSLVVQRLPTATTTARLLAQAELLLERHGIVFRQVLATEQIPGGMAGLAGMLRALEDSGRARRGYFVAGVDARQLALPAAVERLREHDGQEVIVLAATDPANPYGAALPWPKPGHDEARPSRRAGALIVLWHGQPAWFWDAGGKTLVSFAEMAEQDLTSALEAAVGPVLRVSRKRSLRVATIDGQPARQSPRGQLLLAAGFRPSLHTLDYD